MLSSLLNMFRVPDLRNKVLFTLTVIGLYQFGANIPVPGVSYQRVQSILSQVHGGGALGFLNLFSGGALSRVAVFGLGIMPYITSSIIVQLLTTVIPRFEEWRDQGAVGQRKLTQVTRYLTVALAVMQSTGLAWIFHSGTQQFFGLNQNVDLVPHFSPQRVMFIVLSMTAGTAFVMWLGELITQRGIGQGQSILIMSNVVAGIPTGGSAILAQGGGVHLGVFIAVVLALLVGIVFVEQGQRRIPVTFAKRVMGRRMTAGQSTYIPLKVNQAGVVPVIFASSVLYLPVLLDNVIPWRGFRNFVNQNLNGTSLWYISFYGVLILAFTFFYVSITFDPHQQADIIRKQGGYIPGIRPGPPTERYLARILYRITLPGSLFLAFVALTPSVFLALWSVNRLPFAGTTILITVGVVLETMKQIDSQLMMRNYEGFLR
jgi:preprotein translocase subunit SecY